MKFDDFKATFDVKISKGIRKLDKKTKNGSKTEHVCMITNAGLRKLRDYMIKEANAKVNDLDQKNLLFDAAALTAIFDVRGMRDVFLGLPK